jgi:hypothetical protein
MVSGGNFTAAGTTLTCAGLFNPDYFVVEHNPLSGATTALSLYGGDTTDRYPMMGRCGANAVCIGGETLANSMYGFTRIGGATLTAAVMPSGGASNFDGVLARIVR